MEKKLSTVFGQLIGAMWMAEILVGNLGGTPVLGNLSVTHPRIYALAPKFALAAVLVTLLAGLVAANRTGSIAAALRVGVGSGLISGGIVFLTCGLMLLPFRGAMMQDPSYVHEFARSAHRVPTETELSAFLFWDDLGAMVNHLWIGPLLGITVGGVGALCGKWQSLAEKKSPAAA
jgi:hypothetical protein